MTNSVYLPAFNSKISTYCTLVFLLPLLEIFSVFFEVFNLQFYFFILFYPLINLICILLLLLFTVPRALILRKVNKRKMFCLVTLTSVALVWNIVLNVSPVSNKAQNYALMLKVNRSCRQEALVKWCDQIEQTPISKLPVDRTAKIYNDSDGASYPLLKSSIPQGIRNIMDEEVYSHVRLDISKNGVKFVRFICYEGRPGGYGLYVGRNITVSKLGDTQDERLVQWSHSIIAWYFTGVN